MCEFLGSVSRYLPIQIKHLHTYIPCRGCSPAACPRSMCISRGIMLSIRLVVRMDMVTMKTPQQRYCSLALWVQQVVVVVGRGEYPAREEQHEDVELLLC